MSIKIVCEECGTKKKVNERFAGRRVRCPQCEAAIRVPAEPPPSPPEDSASGSSVGDAPSGSPSSDGSSGAAAEVDSADAWDQATQTGTSVTPVVDADSVVDAGTPVEAPSVPATVDSTDPVPAVPLAVPLGDGEGADGQSSRLSAVASVEAAIAATKAEMPTDAEDASSEDVGSKDASLEDSDVADDEEDDEVLVRSKKPEEEMDMTPMVDVTFLLLIFFMVTAAFSLQKSIEMPRQQTEAPSTTNDEPEEETEMVDVEVDENGSFLVLTNDWERETPGKQNLIAALREANAGKNEPMKLNVKVHESAKVKAMVDAMDAGTIADYSPILITQVDGFD